MKNENEKTFNIFGLICDWLEINSDLLH